MTKPTVESVNAVEIRYTKEDVEDLRREVEDLKAWKRSCSIWAAGWAGVCGAVMVISGFIHTYYEKLIVLVEKLR